MESLARSMKEHLPPVLLQMMEDESWKGGQLVQLDSDLSRPSSGEVALNYCWLKPVVLSFPESVPSGVFLTDVFLYLNSMLNNTTFHPTAEKS